jgi:chemotaxis signal transduction protein
MKQNRTAYGAPKQKKFCVFTVGGRDFLLPAEEVSAILEISKIYPMNSGPDYVYAALPAQGKIVTAIDLSMIYPIEKAAFVTPKLVIVQEKGKDVGFLCEAAPFFVTYSEDMIVDDLIDTNSFFREFRLE